MSEELRARLDRLNRGELPIGFDFNWSSGKVLDDRLFLPGGMIDDRQGQTRSRMQGSAKRRVIGLIR